MEFIEFKIPTDIENLSKTGYFYIPSIIKDKDGLKIHFNKDPKDKKTIIFDFKNNFQDYRISAEGRRLNDHHVSAKFPKHWLLIEVKNSDYLKKIDEEEHGLLLKNNPNLIHYMTGDIDFCIDIISNTEPKVYLIQNK